MKKVLLVIAIFITLSFSLPVIASAHPGRTDASGCHQCLSCTPYSNLYQWNGNLYPYYHCHNSGSVIQPVEPVAPIVIHPQEPGGGIGVVVPPIEEPKTRPTIDTSYYDQLVREREERNKQWAEENKRQEEEIQRKLDAIEKDRQETFDKKKQPLIIPTRRPIPKATLTPTATPTPTITITPTPTVTPYFYIVLPSIPPTQTSSPVNTTPRFWQRVFKLFNIF